MCPDMRLGLALGADGSDGFCPSTAERWNCRASSAAGPASPQVRDPRDERLDPRDQCGDQGVFSGKSGGGVTRRFDSYRDVAATKKIQSQTPAHLHTLKRA